MTDFKTPADKAKDDAVKHGLLKANWIERRAERIKYVEEIRERTIFIPSHIDVKKLPLKQPNRNKLPEKEPEPESLEPKRNYRSEEPVGKYGERKCDTPRQSRALTDEEAIICRRQCREVSYRKLALYFDVSENSVIRCIKGYTYKHLNHIARPAR